MRIFEDELLEFERVFHKLVHFALNEAPSLQTVVDDKDREIKGLDTDLSPTFFEKLYSTGSWREFEKYTSYLLKLLGIQTVYSFLGERQAGKADGFFKIGNLAVMYDCTLDSQDVENSKREQLNNYCNRLTQGSIGISDSTTEEFYNHHKQVWIITRGTTRQIKLVNNIEVKEVAIQDIMNVYRERLTTAMSNQSLEMRLRGL